MYKLYLRLVWCFMKFSKMSAVLNVVLAQCRLKMRLLLHHIHFIGKPTRVSAEMPNQTCPESQFFISHVTELLRILVWYYILLLFRKSKASWYKLQAHTVVCKIIAVPPIVWQNIEFLAVSSSLKHTNAYE